MNKKAFTMVELLAVITIICLIGLVSIPAVTNLTEQMDEKEYQRYLKDLYLATETYIGLRSADYKNLEPNQTINITVSELLEEDLIKSDMQNPKTEQIVKRTDVIKVTIQSDYTYKYEYIPS